MERELALATATILAAYLLESSDDDEDEQDRRRMREDLIARRNREEFYAQLLVELRAEEPELYRNFLPMNFVQFDQLLGLVSPHIQKPSTNSRDNISAGERLMLTLRYLATGENFRSLQDLFRIPAATISTIVIETSKAIFKVLVKQYMKVARRIFLFVVRANLIPFVDSANTRGLGSRC